MPLVRQGLSSPESKDGVHTLKPAVVYRGELRQDDCGRFSEDDCGQLLKNCRRHTFHGCGRQLSQDCGKLCPYHFVQKSVDNTVKAIVDNSINHYLVEHNSRSVCGEQPPRHFDMGY